MSSNFLLYKKNVFPTALCHKLIDLYEANADKERFELQLKPQFTQVTLQPEVSQQLFDVLQPTISEYLRKYPVPTTGNMELFRIKKYEPNTQDQFDWHCDSIGDSCSRFLAILIYLNDVESTGETEFASGELFQPSTGSVLMFPPFWTHPHRGLPVSGATPKYILSTYFRF